MNIPKVNAFSQDFAFDELKLTAGFKINEDGYFIIRFHPTLPVLACSSISQVLLFASSTGWFDISFSTWKKTLVQFEQSQRPIEIIAMDWNMNGTQLAVGCSSGISIIWDYPSGGILLEEENPFKLLTEINWNLFQTDILASLDYDRTQLLSWDFGALDCTSELVNKKMSIVQHEESEDEGCKFEDTQEETIDKIYWKSSEKITICFDNGFSEISDNDDSLKTRFFPLEKGRCIIMQRDINNEAKHFSWFFDLMLLLALLLYSSLLLMTSLVSLIAFLVPLLMFLTFSTFFVSCALSACLVLAIMLSLTSINKN